MTAHTPDVDTRPRIRPARGLHSVTVQHTFETAHRLPHLGGKCRSLHGHSWRVRITVAAPTLADDGTVLEFSALKLTMRTWIDQYLDHGTMLGRHDPLLSPLLSDGCKVFVFGSDWDGADWPTVEAVAAMLADRAAGWVDGIRGLPDGTHIAHVQVTETGTNRAQWTAVAP